MCIGLCVYVCVCLCIYVWPNLLVTMCVHCWYYFALIPKFVVRCCILYYCFQNNVDTGHSGELPWILTFSPLPVLTAGSTGTVSLSQPGRQRRECDYSRQLSRMTRVNLILEAMDWYILTEIDVCGYDLCMYSYPNEYYRSASVC